MRFRVFEKKTHSGRTDRQTDGLTDSLCYRDAWTHLKEAMSLHKSGGGLLGNFRVLFALTAKNSGKLEIEARQVMT